MLTKKQKQILDFVKTYHDKKGYSPSHEEIRKRFRYASVSTAHHHLKKLHQQGYLRKEEHRPRAIDVFENEPMVQIPLLGLVAAGQPIEAVENKETIAVPQRQLPFPKGKSDIFALRVTGDSMIDENINDGDIVLVNKQSTARNGEKVVALIDNYDTTLKTFYKEHDHIRLQPANKKLDPIIVDESCDFEVTGVVIDVIQKDQKRKSGYIEKKKYKKAQSLKPFLNKIFRGDIMNLLPQLPNGSVDVIFGDPDYNVGIKYEGKSYTKGFDEYIEWYIDLTKKSLEALKEDGNLFMINYPKQNAHLRVKYLDANFPYVSEYVWVYNTNVGHTPKRFTTAHRSILHVRKSKNNRFYKDQVALPYKNPTDRRIIKNIKNGSRGRMPYSWLEFNLVKNVSKEKTYHSCQIPQKLTKTLIKATTKPGDTALVLFGGSGSEIEVCKKLERNFISAEIDNQYCKLIEDRIEKGYITESNRLFPKKQFPSTRV